MNRPCKDCIWFELWSSAYRGICNVPEKMVAMPASYHIIKDDVCENMDYNCPFWEAK